ncbi:hypothetical protein, partial [Streptomyces spiralis]
MRTAPPRPDTPSHRAAARAVPRSHGLVLDTDEPRARAGRSPAPAARPRRPLARAGRSPAPAARPRRPLARA